MPSDVWNYFSKDANDTSNAAICKLCTKKIARKGNTSNLFYHLNTKHDIQLNKKKRKSQDGLESDGSDVDNVEIAEPPPSTSNFEKQPTKRQCITAPLTSRQKKPNDLKSESESRSSSVSASTSKPKQKQATITSFVSNVNSFQRGGEMDAKITKALLQFIAMCFLPFSIVESTGFKMFMNVVCPRYQIPSRKTITRKLKDMYDAQKQITKTLIEKADNIALTSDIWTEKYNNVSYLGITAHFLSESDDGSPVLRNVNLDLIELNDNHTAKNIQEYIQNALNDWRIPNSKIIALVTDGAANVVKASSDLFGAVKHQHCFAHILHLIVTKFLDSATFKPLLDATKAIVTFFKQSVKAADELRHHQTSAAEDLVDKIPKKLIQSVPTRWNSSYYMIERFLELSPIISSILVKIPNAPNIIQRSDLDRLKELLRVLKPFENVTKNMSSKAYGTASIIIPLANCLMNFSENDEDELISTLRKETSKRFKDIEFNKLLAPATVLDPRFKTNDFKNAIAVSKVLRSISDYLKNKTQTFENEKRLVTSSNKKGDSKDTDNVWAFRQLTKKTVLEDDEEYHYELKHYLKEELYNINDSNFDIFKYWNTRKEVYPQLYQLHSKYSIIPGTSVPAERLFSRAGFIKSPSRNRLSSEKLKITTFLSDHF